jgi:hypothetical protein
MTPLALGATERARTEGSGSDDSGFGSRDNGPSGPTCSINFHHVRATEVDGALNLERAAHWILSWFDDDHGAAQGRGTSERVGDVVKRKSAAPVTARSRVAVHVNDGQPTALRRVRREWDFRARFDSHIRQRRLADGE